MISRASYDVEGRLRRAKSASSVRKRRQAPPLPEPLDPETARQHAMAAASRAMLRASERSSLESRGSYDYFGGNEKPSGFPDPQRRRPPSIRFADDDCSISQISVTLSPSAPPSNAVDEKHTSPLPGNLPPISEFQGLDGGDSSVPSSYRRLRKAKSMFSTRHRAPNTYGASIGLEYNTRMRGPSEENRSPMTLRRSMSFLRGGSQNPRALRHTKSQDAAIQLARSQFLQDLELQDQQQARRSSIFALKQRRQQKPFRKTVRSTSASSPDAGASPSGLGHHKGGTFQTRARTFSISIKKGFKRVFGRSKSSEERPPAQQSSVSRSRFGDYVSTDESEYRAATATEESPSHGQGYGTSHDYPDGIEPTIRTMQSSESLCTSNSRVTSWTDSTAANTVTTRHTVDQNPLSVIREQGDPNQQSSLGSPDSRRLRERYAVFSKPLKARPSANKLDGTVDSQRVYSALMKRIDKNSPQNRNGGISLGTVKGGQPIHQRAPSVYSHRSGQSIRRVPSEASMKSARSFFTANARPPSVQSRSSLRSNYPGDLTPQQNVHRNGKTSHRRSKQSLRESESTFFPTSPYGKPETPSPYRRAMASIHEARSDSDDDSSSVIVSKQIHSETASDSPSVYSRTTSGNTPTKENKKPDMDPFESHEEPGMATIYASHTTPYRSPRRTDDSLESTESSVKPSAEWQKWMSSQIARIDRQGPTISPRVSTPRAHYREETQIDNSELQQTNLSITLHPSTSLEDRIESIKPVQRPDSPHIPDGRSPLMELKIPAQNNFSRPLYRSSSALTIVPTHRLMNSIEPLSSNPGDDIFNAHSNSQQQSASPPSALDNNPIPSLTYSNSNNSIRDSASPTPRRDAGGAAQQRRLLRSQLRNGVTRQFNDIHDAKSVPFRSIRGRGNVGRLTKENSRNQQSPFHRINAPENGAKLHDVHSTITSKHMVDMFLNSRRRQTDISEEGSTSEPAFL